MNLVEQIFEQAKLGTAQDPNANPFAEGMRIGVAQQHADIAKQQLALEIAQAPLKQTLLQQDAALGQAKLQLFLQGREDTAKATQAFAGLASQVSPLLESGQIDDAQNVLMKEGANNAFLLTDPRFKALYEFTTKAQDAKMELLKARTNFDTKPELQTLVNPKTGKSFPVVTMPGSHAFQVLDPERAELTKKAQELRAQQLQMQLPDPAKAELRSLHKRIDRKYEELDDKAKYPDEVWSFGFPPSKVPNPKRAALQKEIADLEEKANKIAPVAPTAAASDNFEIGVTYTDANGNKAIYRGNGKWEQAP